MLGLFGLLFWPIVVAIVALIVIPLAVKVVREYQRLVVFRFGRSIGRKGPGLVFLIPLIDRPVWVDLREAFLEIREILPPREVQEAMTRQMSAERSRRAVVTEADGKRQATITVAEGDKQSAILRAEGDRQAAILRAEGFALALNTIFAVAQTVDSKTMVLQYLEALKALGASPATKFIFPLEFTRLLGPLGDMAGRAFGDKEAGHTP